MDNEPMESALKGDEDNAATINSFREITSSSREEAVFFLESHNWDLDAAVSTFLDNNTLADAPPLPVPVPVPVPASPNSPSQSPSYSPSLAQSPSLSYSPSRSPSRSRSASPARAPYELRSRRATKAKKKPDKPSGSRTRGVRTLADLNQPVDHGSDSDSDEPQEYYTGGEKSGMLVQDPTKGNDVDSIFNQARERGVERPADNQSSRSRSFTGRGRLLSGEVISSAPEHPEVVTHTITFWQNGFTVDDGPLRRMDDPENAQFLESIKNSECPQELAPADRRTAVHVDLVRREEPYNEPKKPQFPFRGTGRTLGSTSSSPAASEPTVAASSINTPPTPFMGLVVDDSLPSTSIQLRLADGTRMVSRFNYSHTIRDVRAFIDASRPGGERNYQLQTMGFPPKKLNDLDQTIEQAGIANSVVIQKF
ncbi:plant UBX domain-containing protein 4 [Rhodamnia argentea]|uniref:Plant UBX domain-containing protein 4 n=1 Tax=Rhodamnia argentea TaxID=178133 RepID=A0A8B8PY35_9MYRT|nr:plant UBX domain-containing protein 4 [Rhodamnia argentea]